MLPGKLQLPAMLLMQLTSSNVKHMRLLRHLAPLLPQPAPAQAMGLRGVGVVAEAGMLVAVAGVVGVASEF